MATVVAIISVVVATAPAPAAADDSRAQQQKVAEQKAQAAAKTDVLHADAQHVQQALDALDANAQNQTATLAAAQAAERQSVVAAGTAQTRAVRAATALGDAKRRLVTEAVRQYSQVTRRPTSLIVGDDINEVARSMTYDGVVTSSSSNVVDLAHQARVDLDAANRAAAAAARNASIQRSTAEAQLTRVQAARADQQRVADALEQKIAATTSELDGLTAKDAQLSAQILAQDAAARDAAAKAAAASLQVAATSPSAAAGTAPGPRSVSGAAALPAISGTPAVPVSTENGMSTVRGITVASSIAAQLSAMLAASDVAGLRLSGGGYRSSDEQIALRRAHCGSSQYDIYSKPASACSPPTAPPGRSMHERGLAIDFTSNGSLISSHNNPAWHWLSANAAR